MFRLHLNLEFAVALLCIGFVASSCSEEEPEFIAEKEQGIPVTLVYEGKEYLEFTKLQNVDPINVFDKALSEFQNEEIKRVLSTNNYAILVPENDRARFELFNSADELKRAYRLSPTDINAKIEDGEDDDPPVPPTPSNSNLVNVDVTLYDAISVNSSFNPPIEWPAGNTVEYKYWNVGTHFEARHNNLYSARTPWGTTQNWDNKPLGVRMMINQLNGPPRHALTVTFTENVNLTGRSVWFMATPDIFAYRIIPSNLRGTISSMNVFVVCCL